MGDGWSIAWRVHDAQFWGVPQRRKRISLVADFGGESAPEILFERKSVSGNPEQSGTERERAADTIEGDTYETISFQERAGCEGGARESLYSTNEQEPCQRSITNRCLSIDEKMGQTYIGDDVGNTLAQRDYKQPQAVCISQDAYDKYTESDTSATIKQSGGNLGGGVRVIGDTVGALFARDYKGVGNQYVNEGKVIIQKKGSPSK